MQLWLLLRTSRMERDVIMGTLARIGKDGRVDGMPNIRTESTVYRRNPTRVQIAAMRRAGIRL